MLPDFLKSIFKGKEHILFSQYMQTCQHYYYTNRQPLGQGGDFITAPDISPLFGEMIGLWALDKALGLDRPCAVVELGSGSGALLKHAMTAVRNIRPDAEIDFFSLDINPHLRTQQASAWQGFDVVRVSSFDGLPTDKPIIIIANEFFDAFAVDQVRPDGTARYVTKNLTDIWLKTDLQPWKQADKISEIFEIPTTAIDIFKDLCQRIYRQHGHMLVIDYGFFGNTFFDSVQALYKHNYVGVYDHIGDADLTFHIPFDWFAQIAQDIDLQTHSSTQSDFLQSIGINMRLQQILPKLSQADQENHILAVNRLLAHGQMGTLFKVLQINFT